MNILKILLLVLLISASVQAQFYQGPATGNITGGVLVTTDDFSAPVKGSEDRIRGPLNIRESNDISYFLDHGYISPFEGKNYYDDPNVNPDKGMNGVNNQTILLNDFNGFDMTNSIPPDPIIAVGPDHILGCVNTEFKIWDRDGNLIKHIGADEWNVAVHPNPGAFDPQVIYDHFAQRWVMLWDNVDDVNQTAFFFVSVSDDENPLGEWYIYALPSNKNGNTTVANWGDYPQIGFDEFAIYINSRSFTYPGFYQYNKIRIIDKSILYNANGGPVSWQDIWDIGLPSGGSSRPDVIHPTIPYESSSKYYLLYAADGSGNTVSLYWIEDPTGTPTLTGADILVPSYIGPPPTNQLGGGTPPIDNGGSKIRTAPILRDGYLYAVHAIRNPAFIANSAIEYYKIDVNTNTLEDNGIMGAQGYYYVYPTVTVDKDHNMAITYSRSADTEYMGAYYTTRFGTDPPSTLSGSYKLKEGMGNYVVTFGSNRNRWGDYLGIYLDPDDEANVIMLTEYVASQNTWGTWIGEIRMSPFPGVYAYTATPTLDFGDVEVTFVSEPIRAVLKNIGEDALEITGIPSSVGPFNLLTSLSFPITLNSYDSLELEFEFAPVIPGLYEETFTISSNDPMFTGFLLVGNGYQINAANENIMYGYSGAFTDANLIQINLNTGEGTLIGSAIEDGLECMDIDPVSKLMYGFTTDEFESVIYRMNALGGDSYAWDTLDLANIKGMAFDTLGVLYVALSTGELYSVDLNTRDYTFVSESHLEIEDIAIDPTTNQMYASTVAGFGLPKDKIYTIDVQTGDTLLIGRTGFAKSHNSIGFSREGQMYAAVGTSPALNDLIAIDKVTGLGTLIGAIGYKDIRGMDLIPGEPTAAPDDQITDIPDRYDLGQNYPNPFNPSTIIQYQMPEAGKVRLVVYNLLGEVVSILKNGYETAGFHQVQWNATDNRGNKLSSGIYFYELKIEPDGGKGFNKIRKMILMK